MSVKLLKKNVFIEIEQYQLYVEREKMYTAKGNPVLKPHLCLHSTLLYK